MLCINKRLYRSDRSNRSNRPFCIGAAGQLSGGVFHAIPDGDDRHSFDL